MIQSIFYLYIYVYYYSKCVKVVYYIDYYKLIGINKILNKPSLVSSVSLNKHTVWVFYLFRRTSDSINQNPTPTESRVVRWGTGAPSSRVVKSLGRRRVATPFPTLRAESSETITNELDD